MKVLLRSAEIETSAVGGGVGNLMSLQKFALTSLCVYKSVPSTYFFSAFFLRICVGAAYANPTSRMSAVFN